MKLLAASLVRPKRSEAALPADCTMEKRSGFSSAMQTILSCFCPFAEYRGNAKRYPFSASIACFTARI